MPVFEPDPWRCDKCAIGIIYGSICAGCRVVWCQPCIDKAKSWYSLTCAAQVYAYCNKCSPMQSPHSPVTCSKCVDARASADRLRAHKRQTHKSELLYLEATAWPRMLKVIHGVDAARASAIVAEYPNPAALLLAYRGHKRSGHEMIDNMLADLRTPAGKRVGRAASTAVRRVMVPDVRALD